LSVPLFNSGTSAGGETLPPLSVLDVALIEDGQTARAALNGVATVAVRADAAGYQRFWVAEHHAARSIASVAPAVLLAHLAGATGRIRLGSGGVMLPNHSPLAVAEQFATLTALHPGRIDLGVGRGPGTHSQPAIASLRRGSAPVTDREYEDALDELMAYLAGEGPSPVLAGATGQPLPWLLSSSTAGAQLAGRFGLPMAFAYHIRPDNTAEALDRYRDHFVPSRWCDEPRVILSVDTVCAPTGAEATVVGRPGVLLVEALPRTGGDAVLPTPEQAAAADVPPEAEDRIAQRIATQAHGSPEAVRSRLAQITKDFEPDELMLHTPVYDPELRARSLELVAGAADSARPS
jgi:luciferase family oxidoreductase group 1